MVEGEAIESASDKLLFTPGPLTTSSAVKQAMLRDVGSRDQYFIATVQSIRNRLVAIAGDDGRLYTTTIEFARALFRGHLTAAQISDLRERLLLQELLSAGSMAVVMIASPR